MFDQTQQPDRSSCTRTWVADIENMVSLFCNYLEFKSKYFQIHDSSIAATEIVEELIKRLRGENLLFGGDILDITQLLKRFCFSGHFAFFVTISFSVSVKSLPMKKWWRNTTENSSRLTCSR